MTSHYIDITLLPDPEFSPAHLLGARVAKLHRALVQLRAEHIGISFPGYSLRPRTLGDILRLHGTETELQSLMSQAWLQGMRDHVKVTGCVSVPPDAAHCVVQRRQFKTNVERLRRRRMRRKGNRQNRLRLRFRTAWSDVRICRMCNSAVPARGSRFACSWSRWYRRRVRCRERSTLTG